MPLPRVVEDLLRVAAPVLAGALTGPLAPIAATIAAGALDAWLGPRAASVAAGDPPVAVQPPEVVQAVIEHADDPKFLLALRQADLDLQKYEADLGFRFADLEQRDRADARQAAADSGQAHPQFVFGMSVVVLSLLMLAGIVAGCIMALTGTLTVDPASAPISIAAFGLLGTVVGVFQAVSAQILAFYFGSSASSAEKSTQIGTTMRDLGSALGDAARATPPRAAPVPLPAQPGQDEGRGTAPQPAQPLPAAPAPPGLLAELLPSLTAPHRHFPDGVSWALTMGGISIEGAPAQGTPGEPVTVRTVWQRYGALFQAAARQYGVPVELLVATCCVESRGDASARRAEPRIGDASTGLMQTLRATARQALGRRDLTDDDLLDPATSIAAGAAYIAQQRTSTHFDPPLVAAAYNAGSLRRDDGPANRWRLLVYPVGTGRHIDSFCGWLADALRVSAEQGWGQAEGVPSFASCLSAHSDDRG